LMLSMRDGVDRIVYGSFRGIEKNWNIL